MELQIDSNRAESTDLVSDRKRAHEPGEEGREQSRSIAERIVSDIRPSTVLDVGCGTGLLVRALRQAAVEAFGIDASEDSIQSVPADTQPYCRMGPVTNSLPQRYDLIICLEGLANLPDSKVEQAIQHFCQNSDDVLFSSAPTSSDGLVSFDDKSPEYWAEVFARHGFYRDLDFDASFIAPWALRFRKAADPPLAVAAYESQLRLLQRESQARRELNISRQKEVLAQEHRLLAQEHRIQAQEQINQALRQQVREWEKRWTDLENSMGWALIHRLQVLRARFAPPGSRREQLLEEAFHALQARKAKSPVHFARRVVGAISWRARVLLCRLRLIAEPPLRNRVLHIQAIEPCPPVQAHQGTVDIIICVHNALSDVQCCLDSVICHTHAPYRLILVDDGSNPETRDYLAGFAETHGAVLLRNEQARRYPGAANQGLRYSTADYVLLLNSDTLVTPQWLDRLIACAESDARIGLVGPLSNTASWQSIPQIETAGDWALNPLPTGMSAEEMAQLLAHYSARMYPSMPFLNGFCLLIRRQVLEEVGYFDEDNFGQGYGEEDDLALRARKAGWQLALADDAYVYHAQSRSYSSEARRQLSEQAGKALARKHGYQIINEGVAICRDSRVLEGIRARSRAMLERQEWIANGQASFNGRRVLFVLPVYAPGGGANVVIDEALAMQEMGVEVEIFNLRIYRSGFERSYPELGIPVLYGDEASLIDLAHQYDAVVATANYSVEWLARISPISGRPVCGYYIQDFEPYMYQAGTEGFQQAWNSYTLFPDQVRVTKTQWTREEVGRQTGADSTVVGCSVNIDLFRPRPRSEPEWPERPLRIAAMIRPDSPYREPTLTMELLRDASRRYGAGVDHLLFGTSPDDPGFGALPRDFAWKLAGMLSQRQVVRFLNEADIFVDFSSHQAMGLTALEAMACGAAVIVPRQGGAISYARHEENCLVVDTSSREACWTGLTRLIEDHVLRSRLQRNALVDVCSFYPERPAFNILSALFEQQASAVP